MMRHNIYHDGAVQSLSFTDQGERATVGVMTPGRWRFAADVDERVELLSGELRLFVPGEAPQAVSAPSGYDVPGGTVFEVEMACDVAYVCRYYD